MTKITKKDMRIMVLLSDFGFLDDDFFITLFHSKSNRVRSKTIFTVKKYLNKLIEMNFVSHFKSHDGITFYSITPNGRSHLLFRGIETYPNNLTINSGKFFHSRLCSLVYAKIAAIYDVNFLSENSLLRSNDSPIVPDLAVKRGETVVYFEIERSLKSESLIKAKLSNYNSKFNDGYLVYLTERDSIIKTIERLRNSFPNSKKIMAYDLNKFMGDPRLYLCDIGSFYTGVNKNGI
jgi:hypothetical protein